MLQGLNVNERIEFISKSDNSEPKTIFILRPLSGYESATKTTTLEVLLTNIVEIKNMPEGHSDIETYIKSLDQSCFVELITRVNLLNRVTEQEAKN